MRRTRLLCTSRLPNSVHIGLCIMALASGETVFFKRIACRKRSGWVLCIGEDRRFGVGREGQPSIRRCSFQTQNHATPNSPQTRQRADDTLTFLLRPLPPPAPRSHGYVSSCLSSGNRSITPEYLGSQSHPRVDKTHRRAAVFLEAFMFAIHTHT